MMITSNKILGSQIASGSISWDTNDAANTNKVVTIPKPTEPVTEYLLVAYNPSTQTDLTVKVISPRNINSGTRNILLTQLSFAKSQTISGTSVDGEEKPIHATFVNSDLKLVFSNDTGGTLTAFTAHYRLYEVI